MLRRRLVLGAASAGVTAPLLEIVGCGSGSTPDGPVPVPASQSAIRLPADQYLHRGAPTEWWWHIGTLKAGNRTFGFEINASSFQKDGFAFTQIMLTDVNNKRHFQRTTPYLPPLLFDADNWAEHDVTKDWSVKLGDASNHLSAIEIMDPGSGYQPGGLSGVSRHGQCGLRRSRERVGQLRRPAGFWICLERAGSALNRRMLHAFARAPRDAVILCVKREALTPDVFAQRRQLSRRTEQRRKS